MTVTDFFGSDVEMQGKRVISDPFPGVTFGFFPIAAKERNWTRGELAKVFNKNRSVLVKDIAALMKAKTPEGGENAFSFYQNRPLNFTQVYYVFLMRMWFKCHRQHYNHKKPLRSDFVEIILNYFEEDENGKKARKNAERFDNTVALALKKSGKKWSTQAYLEDLLEDFLAKNQGAAQLMDDVWEG